MVRRVLIPALFTAAVTAGCGQSTVGSDDDGSSGGKGDDPGASADAASGTQGDDAGPAPVAIPDVSGFGIDCNNICFNLEPKPGCSSINPIKAKDLYDAYYGPRLPRTEADFQWHEDPTLASREIFEHTVVYGMTMPATVDKAYAMYDFNPLTWQRDTSRTNREIFAGIHSASWDPYEPATAAERNRPYLEFNPLDWLPVAITHYERDAQSDIMATQLVYRLACFAEPMDQAIRLCPDCDDLITVHSRMDLYKIFEVRLVRLNDTTGRLEVSKQLRVISVDSSGHPYNHFPTYPFWFALNRQNLRAKWRAEMSGLLAQRIGFYGVSGSYGALIRLAGQNLPYDPALYVNVPDAYP